MDKRCYPNSKRVDAHFRYVFRFSSLSDDSLPFDAIDQRNPPPLGRIPEPDDIIASVRVEDGLILPETYSPMPTYRLATADGVCILTDTLRERLAEVLEAED